jgi:hypothetical protein
MGIEEHLSENGKNPPHPCYSFKAEARYKIRISTVFKTPASNLKKEKLYLNV